MIFDGCSFPVEAADCADRLSEIRYAVDRDVDGEEVDVQNADDDALATMAATDES